MKVRFWGVRGSIPAPGPETNRYGGNTSCVSVTTASGHLIILDMGTGLMHLGNHLLGTEFGKGRGKATILLSHAHWDHIQGLGFFAPVFIPGNRFELRGHGRSSSMLEGILEGQMNPNFSPLYTLKNLGAAFDVRAIRGQPVAAAVDVALELDALLGDLADVAERMHLEAPAVGEDGTVPAVEFVQASRVLQHIRTWPKVQVVRVAEHHGGLHVLAQLAHVNGFHRTQGPHGHEHGCGYRAVVRMQFTRSGLAVGVGGVEDEFHAGREDGASGVVPKAKPMLMSDTALVGPYLPAIP